MNHAPLINSKSTMIMMSLAVSCPFVQAGTEGYISTSTAAGTSLVGPTAIYAGDAQADINAREAARREAQTKEALQKLQDGRLAYKEGKYQDALNLFKDAWKLMPEAPVTKVWRQHIVDCIGDASIAVAIECSKVGRYDDAEQLLLDVLSRDPNNKRARNELSMLRDPVRNNPALTPEHVRDVEEVNRLLTLAYGYYELGKYNEAYAEFNHVLQIDPYNTAARKGQETISKRRSTYYRAAYNSTRAKMLAEVDAKWEESVNDDLPDMEVTSNESVHSASSGQIRNEEALENIHLAKVTFEGTITDALSLLRAEARNSNQQINFIYEAAPAAAPAAPVASDDSEDEDSDSDEDSGEDDEEESTPAPVAVAPAQPSIINLEVSNYNGKQFLQDVCSQSGCSFRVEDRGVVISEAGAAASKMVRRQWKVTRDFVIPTNGDDDSGDSEEDAFDSGSSKRSINRPNPTAALKDYGVKFGKGAKADYSAATGILTVVNTPDNLDLVEDAIDAHRRQAKNTMVKVSAKFVEVSQANDDELSFDWVVNPFSVNNAGTTYLGGANGSSATTNRNYDNFVTSGGRGYTNNHSNFGSWPISGKTSDTITDGLMTGGLRSGSGAITGNSLSSLIQAGSAAEAASQSVAPGILSLSGIYNDGSFQAIMRGLSQKKGVDMMSAPSLIARPGDLEYTPDPDPLSADQSGDDGCAKIEVIRRFIYASSYSEPQIPDRVEIGGAVAAPSSPDEWSAQELGVVLRFKVDPDIEDDVIKFQHFEIKVQDFEGFVNYGSPITAPSIQTANDNLVDNLLNNNDDTDVTGVSTGDPVLLTENRIDMPIFSRRYINSNPCIYDGHTIVIGGMIEDEVQKVEDKVPVFGDLPLIGRFFRSEAESHTRKNLMIFVTAEKIDPTGKPTRLRDTGTNDSPSGAAVPSLFDDGLANP